MRSAPQGGPSSSEAWDDSFTEISTDLASISTEWKKVVTILNELPQGQQDSAVNAFKNGLDGKTLWVDSEVTTSSADLTFLNATKNRPATLKEALETIYQYVNNQIDQVNTSISASTSALTTDEKNRIGANVFDNTQTSSATSLDGKSERNRLNILQVAGDLYGTGYSLDNDGLVNLTNSHAAILDALLELHNGDYDGDITIDHVGVFSPTQQDVGASAVVDDTFTGPSTNTEDNINRIRNVIKVTKGTAAWTSSHTPLYSGGASSLEELLSSTSGSASKSSSNPWGYQWDDISGLETRLNAIRDFTGQDSTTDDTPTYSSLNYVTNNVALEVAIGELDAAILTQQSNLQSEITIVSGVNDTQQLQLDALETFVGQDSNTDSSPNYSSNSWAQDGTSLETAIGALDAALTATSGDHRAQLDAVELFVGQSNNTDSSPSYSSTTFVTNGTSLETAIGDIDSQLTTTSGIGGDGTGPPSGMIVTGIQGNPVTLVSPASGESFIYDGSQWNYQSAESAAPAYGEMYISSTSLTTVVATPTFTKIAGTYTAGELENFTHSAGTLTYTGTDTKKFHVDVSMSGDSNATDVFHFRVAKNGTSVAKTEIDRRISGAQDVGAMALHGIIELSTNDTVEVQVANDGGSADITAERLIFVIVSV